MQCGDEQIAQVEAADPGPPMTIVAIGASAGGLDALRRFFTATTPHPRIAYAVISHLAPKAASVLAELLASSTTMLVAQAREGDRVEAKHVYVIPPNHYLRIKDGVLHLDPTVSRPTIPMPIDHFMCSLAEDQKRWAVGIVLTGADHDGTVGLKEIRAAGGFTIAQEPATAQHPSMPQSALSAKPDRVLAIEQMPQALIELVERLERTPELAPAAAVAQAQEVELLDEVLKIVRERTGYDFRYYRPAMLSRRLRRRMALKGVLEPNEYLALLREQDEEAKTLSDEFLIGVTEFFREPRAWETLEELVMPALVNAAAGDRTLRVWSVGCASGEEAYSIAMLLRQAVGNGDGAGKVTVFGTDIDARSLQTARSGKYSSAIEATVPPLLLQRFFKKLDVGYEVNKALRETVLFASHNLLADPPYSRLDLIICRNVLIYMQPALQQQLLELFHFALNPGGYLFLGKSESLGTNAARFETISGEWRIYRSIGVRGRPPRDLPARAEQRAMLNAEAISGKPDSPGPQAIVQKLLLDGHAPAAVLVTRDYRVLFFHGRTDQYLEPPQGEPSWDLLSLARQGLRLKLRAALHRAVNEDRSVVTDASIERDGVAAEIRISVEPVSDSQVAGLLLVTFRELPPRDGRTTEPTPVLDDTSAFHQLEAELGTTKRELKDVVEKLETANEELRVSNEEALSANEELQSANEELQTSKEELQSLNEELSTVNLQLESKVQELQRSNDDLNNLLSSTDIPTLFLDGQFKLKRFTSSAKRLFHLIDMDVNRSLRDIASRLTDNSLLDDAQRVFDNLVADAKEVSTDTGQTFLRRILPYRTDEDRIEGVVVTFTDITELRRTTEELRRLAAAMHDSNDAVITYDLTGNIYSWNQGAARTYGYQEQEALAKNVDAIIPPAIRQVERRVRKELEQSGVVEPYDTQRLSRNGELIDALLTLSLLRDEQGAPWGVLSVERNITERKRMELVLTESEARFRALADAIPALVWMEDTERQPQYVNKGFVQFTGRSLERFLPEGWMSLIHSDDAERYETAYSEALRQRSSFEVDFRLRRADGQYRWMRSTGVRRYRDDGEFLGYIGLILDINERKIAEQSLAEADRRKSQFLAMLAHELRNPLAPIRNTVEVLRRSANSDPKIAWATGIIDRQATQLSGLVDELLDVARIARGRVVLHKEPVQISEVVERACEMVRPFIDAHKHTLIVDMPPEPLYVEGDLLRLGQILSNLLSNAAKFTPAGGMITVSVERHGGDVAIGVRDNGAGITPEMLPLVFDLFAQADTTLDRSQGGLGLGLTLVHDLVELHGGRVTAHSNGLGKGSQFIVELPLIQAPVVSEAKTEISVRASPSARVLIAEDNVDAAESLAVLLQMAGHEVRLVHDGRDVLQSVADFKPQAIVLDIGLPGMDGYQLAQHLRAGPETARTVLVALTGYGQPQDIDAAKAAGFNEHFVKPVDPSAILSVIAAVGAARGQ